MGNKSHILDFTSRQSEYEEKKGIRPLPQLVEQARSVFLEDLNNNLKKMLEQADDCLFDMSESGYNNAHFDAMRMLRLKKDGLIRNFQTELKNCFSDNLGKYESLQTNEDSSASLSFENIALVEESDLEEGIAIDGIVKKARNANNEALEIICTRLDTLITNQSISKENNPFEPAFVCGAFKSASLALDIDIESLLVIYKLFERSVVSQLSISYQQVNKFFIDKGVLPDLKTFSGNKKRTPTSSTAYQEEPSFDELLNIATPRQSANPEMSNNEASNDQIIGLMQNLLAQSRRVSHSAEHLSAQSRQSNSVYDGPKIDTSKLVAALTNLQSSNLIETDNTTNVVADLRSVLGRQLGANDAAIQQGALGQFNEDMIDIVSMLFDFILDDRNVHAEIKAIIARLQIPMLKVGLVDRTFFSNKKHPARILLNEIARAGISWEPSDIEAQKMLTKIESICEEVNESFSDDISIFSILLNDFQAFKNQIERRADIFERRTREAEEGKARAESARGIVNKELEKICRGRHIPMSVQELLKNVWVNVMFLEKLRDNQEGWERVCQVAKLLVWSVQPVTTASALDKVIGRVPSLIKNLRKGFDIISLSPIDATRMLENLETTHRQLIKNAQERIEAESKEEILRLSPTPLTPEFNSESVERKPEEQTEAVEPIIETIEIQDIGFSKELTGVSEQITQKTRVELKVESLQAIERLSAGHWVELEFDGKNSRCKLAAKISSIGKYIFVNRSGVKMAEYFSDDLAAEYQLGRLKILDEEALFDRALESVISNLRAMKAET